jgi:aconitate hydratase 2/2-methylisocitrate dehydratase
MIEKYVRHEEERLGLGIPAKPLDSIQAEELCRLLQDPPAGRESFLLKLLAQRISPGVDPAAKVKAEFLAGIITGSVRSSLVKREDAVIMLGTMLGGYNIPPLIAALEDAELGTAAAAALSATILVYDSFDEVKMLAKTSRQAKNVLESWANAEWFTRKSGLTEK